MGCLFCKDPSEDDYTQMPDENEKSIGLTKNTGSKYMSRSAVVSSKTVDPGRLRVATEFMVGEKKGKIQDFYQLMSPPIGVGGYGEVRKAIHINSGVVRAVKVINKKLATQQEIEKLMNEVNILKKLDHPNVIKIYEFYQDAQSLYIVTDLCTGGELFERIVKRGAFNEADAAEIMRQVLSAISYCHAHKIMHRDIKPENLLYESPDEGSLLKVIDFGGSQIFKKNEMFDRVMGTAYYIAPEVLEKNYNEKCDIWSCGVLMYTLLCGYPPFRGKNEGEIMKRVITGEFRFEPKDWAGVSDEAKDLIADMLEMDIDVRVSARDALKHPWFKKMIERSRADSIALSNALANLRTFRADKKLQHAVWVYLVHQLATLEEQNELAKCFKRLDKNGDGQISREELLEGYKHVAGTISSEIDVDGILKAIDSNNSGAIDYSEFVVATINRKKLLSEKRLEAAFKLFDKDASGDISIEEFREIFEQGSENAIEDSLWKKLIQTADKNEDGKISLDEFKEMMLNYGLGIVEENNEQETEK